MSFTYPDCSECSMKCVELSGNKIKTKQNEPICCLYSDKTLPKGKIIDILVSVEDRVNHAAKIVFPEVSPPSDQALRNLYGAWFEKVLTVISWNIAYNYSNDNPTKKRVVIPLPNASVLKFWELFDIDAQNKLEEGLFSGMRTKGITMTMSNPDYICISTEDNEFYSTNFGYPIREISINSLWELDNKYEFLRNRCKYNSFIFGLSVKTELRPDRRYQIIYEGSIFKALLSHLMMRYWNKDIKMKYYGLTLKSLSSGDLVVMTNPAIDSLISVWVEPRRAVDEIVNCSSIKALSGILTYWFD